MRYTVGGLASALVAGMFATYGGIAAQELHLVTASLLVVVALILVVFGYSLIERNARRR